MIIVTLDIGSLNISICQSWASSGKIFSSQIAIKMFSYIITAFIVRWPKFYFVLFCGMFPNEPNCEREITKLE